MGTIHVVSILLGNELSCGEIAELASHIEIDVHKRPIGKQDQYASAFGGFNEIRFSSDGVTVTPLDVDAEGLAELSLWTMLFYTGKSRDSATILSRQTGQTKKGQPKTVQSLHEIKARAEEMKQALVKRDFVLLGQLIDASWQAKKALVDGISTERIDELYGCAIREGAIGGKITGAGGGGFLMLIRPPDKQADIEEQLTQMGLIGMPFSFTSNGTRIVS